MKTLVLRILPVLVLYLGLLLPNSAHAVPVITGGTETSTGGIYFANFMNGYDFVSTANQSLTALGYWDQGANGFPLPTQVGLWATATQTLLASVVIFNDDPLDLSVVVSGGSWRYETLSSAVALTAGTTYTLAWQVGPLNLSATNSLYIDYPTLTSNPTVTIADQRRFLGTSGFTFPTNTGAAGSIFSGMVNAQIGPATVPEPSSLALGVWGLACLCAMRHKQKS